MTIVELINLVAMVLLGGLLSFLATLLVKQVTWPAWVNIGVSFALALLFALATAWINGDIIMLVSAWGSLTAESVFSLFILYWTAASAWYWVVFKDAAWAHRVGAWPKPLTHNVE